MYTVMYKNMYFINNMGIDSWLGEIVFIMCYEGYKLNHT